METSPKIFSRFELTDYLYCLIKKVPIGLNFKPWDFKLIDNNNKERSKFKRTCKLIEKYLKCSKEYKTNKNSKKIDLTEIILKLLLPDAYLGSRRGLLMLNKNYFLKKQGSIFWINMIKRVLKKIFYELKFLK